MSVSWDQAKEWEHVTADLDFVAVHFAMQRTTRWDVRLQIYRARMSGAITTNMDYQLELRRRARIGTEFHGFMNLSRELRDMIYTYLVVKGSVFLLNYPGPMDGNMDINELRCHFQSKDFYGNTYLRYEGMPADLTTGQATRKPIGLICGVSTTVQYEATAMFYGCNRFVFPYGRCNIPAVCPGGPLDTFQFLRDVSYTFDMRHIKYDPYAIKYQGEDRHQEDHDPDDSDAEFTVACSLRYTIHERLRVEIVSQWRSDLGYFQLLALDRLQLSFDECYCPMGCCRLIKEATECFLGSYRPSRRKLRLPRVIEIIGWNDESEKQYINRKLGALEGYGMLTESQFLGKSKKDVRQELRAAGLL
ncbi:hypothetical protein K449DRAFT_394979 [Hypoxylon sp. EC38]|nr:hypothetical protein K449DRAFT_394979 [Hypoxylon sp. EC38]